ncbi:hypothetical protein HPP92_010556 [Vanilla planifolia]|uniref:Glycoside hydrolase family 13 N-terminal domain-containing protein n=1 Tax=Vanilla planifolia TaxID=51239 RepID=A0A835RAN3_VANPL|nr:hypothetical protein HPP92_010556 [Vanilla planifolia]
MDLEAVASFGARAPGRGIWSGKWRVVPFTSRFQCREAERSCRLTVNVNVRCLSVRMNCLVARISAGGAAEVENAVTEGRWSGAYKVLGGMPLPLGATPVDEGVNFAVYSGSASAVTLCLFACSDFKKNRVTVEIPLDPLKHKTGSIWHVFVAGEFRDVLYGYKFDGKFSTEEGLYFDNSRVLLDPYAKCPCSSLMAYILMI